MTARSLTILWTVSAAFLTYFCMYGFRKPFTAGRYAEPMIGGLDFKELLVIAQVLGYMVSKFIGIKLTSELPPQRRAVGILILIGLAELSLLAFPFIPRPWNAVCLFFNGLPLGMVFGIVLGFLEGRRATEALTAGLCSSFILADGVTKSLGSWLVKQGVTEEWMPATAGLIFLLPLLLGVGMLHLVPPPTADDILARTRRPTMTRQDRLKLFRKYWLALSAIVFVYILVTILRSYRADFGPQLWKGLLGVEVAPQAFSESEFYIAIAILLIGGSTALIRSNTVGFFTSLGISAAGFVILLVALTAWQANAIGPFPLMVLLGLGLYLPYVTIQTTVFERFLAMTKEKGNLSFLMSLADSFGYLGYIAVLMLKSFTSVGDTVFPVFINLIGISAVVSLIVLGIASIGFAPRKSQIG